MAEGRFETTRWSMVLAARDGDNPEAAAALARLCEIYWYPLYVFVRHCGHGKDEAHDLTQGYFLRVLERDYLKDVRPEAGRFRSFLLASLKHYMSHERRARATQKRGGGKQFLSLDAEEADRLYQTDPGDTRSPERAFEQRWAMTVVERAQKRLRGELIAAGKEDLHRSLVGFLIDDSGDRSYREVARELGTSEASVKMAVSRLRKRFGGLLRDEIAETVVEPNQVDAEVRHLLTVLQEA